MIAPILLNMVSWAWYTAAKQEPHQTEGLTMGYADGTFSGSYRKPAAGYNLPALLGGKPSRPLRAGAVPRFNPSDAWAQAVGTVEGHTGEDLHTPGGRLNGQPYTVGPADILNGGPPSTGAAHGYSNGFGTGLSPQDLGMQSKPWQPNVGGIPTPIGPKNQYHDNGYSFEDWEKDPKLNTDEEQQTAYSQRRFQDTVAALRAGPMPTSAGQTQPGVQQQATLPPWIVGGEAGRQKFANHMEFGAPNRDPAVRAQQQAAARLMMTGRASGNPITLQQAIFGTTQDPSMAQAQAAGVDYKGTGEFMRGQQKIAQDNAIANAFATYNAGGNPGGAGVGYDAIARAIKGEPAAQPQQQYRVKTPGLTGYLLGGNVATEPGSLKDTGKKTSDGRPIVSTQDGRLLVQDDDGNHRFVSDYESGVNTRRVGIKKAEEKAKPTKPQHITPFG